MNMHSIHEHVAGLEAEILMRDIKIQKHEVCNYMIPHHPLIERYHRAEENCD